MIRAEKRSRISKLLCADPSLSDRAIGRQLGVDGKTVGKIRSSLVSTAEIEASNVRVGEDGKARRCPKPHDTRALFSSERPSGPVCSTCGGRRFWRGLGHTWICRQCDPPRTAFDVFVEFA